MLSLGKKFSVYADCWAYGVRSKVTDCLICDCFHLLTIVNASQGNIQDQLLREQKIVDGEKNIIDATLKMWGSETDPTAG